MAKWLRLQLADGKFDGKQIVDQAALLETRKPHMLIGSSRAWGTLSFYGLAMNVGYDDAGRLRLSHSGAFALGAGTNINLVPSENLAIVVLSNASPTGVPEALAATFVDLAIEGKPRLDWLALYKDAFAKMMAASSAGGAKFNTPPASAAPALGNSAYIGVYENDYFGEIEIVAAGDGLSIVEGPKGKTKSFPLKHFDRDTFTYVTEGESAIGTSGVYFTIDADGKASVVRVENLDAAGNGTFKRKANASK